MSRKFTASRRAAFLRALAATGNFTLAAARARLLRSWVSRQRTLDPDFRAACDAAHAEALARLAAGAGTAAPAGWGHLDGAELVVRGQPGRRAIVARARIDGWSPAVEERFLSVLAATCNVKAACVAAGMTQASAYGHRRKWRNFAERWAAALDQGFVRLEAGLLECGGNVFSGEEVPASCPVHSISADQAIHLLWLHRHEVRGYGRKPERRWPKQRPIEEVRASILRKIEAIQNARDIPEEMRAADRAEWAARRPDAG